MAIVMCNIVDKTNHIPVDEWDTPKYPIEDKDRIFRNIRGEIILPICEFFYGGDEEEKSLNYFAMNAKRSYNSDVTREHICRYLNYFEKFYDCDNELLMVIFQIKINIDRYPNYGIDQFMDDVNRYIIRNLNLTRKITHFVEDNYMMNLSSNNNKTPNLQFNNRHAKVLYSISMLMNMYIPLATHYMYIHNIKSSVDIQKFMLRLFDMCNKKYYIEQGIDIYNKIYETALSVVNKSKNPDKVLWEKNQIRGINTTTHTKDSVCDIILQIMPKYNYLNDDGEEKNIINFNYFSNRQCLRYKIIDIQYEFPFSKLSSSRRDEDNNSEFDKYEAKNTKKDEALTMQNKVAAEQTVNSIVDAWGPITDAEVEHYRRKLTKDGAPVINSLQLQLVGYLYYRMFGDPITLKAIRNQTDYIKLIICGKRMLRKMGMVILPYIFSSKVCYTMTRKIISKKDMIRIESSNLYSQIVNKYRNPKIEQRIWEFISMISASKFEIIECDENGNPTQLDGNVVPMINDILNEELMLFISFI